MTGLEPDLVGFHISVLNTFMNYTAADIEKFIGQYERHFTHVIVAHTKFRPYINPYSKSYSNNQLGIQRMAEQAKRDCRHALNCFNKLLYPGATNKPKRHPELYRPLTFVTIEGARETTDRAQTIHFNITLGNLPIRLTAHEVEVLFTHAWHVQAKQSNDVFVEDYFSGTSKQWIGYTLKEAQQAKHKAWTTDGIWDVENSWIPHAALAED